MRLVGCGRHVFCAQLCTIVPSVFYVKGLMMTKVAFWSFFNTEVIWRIVFLLPTSSRIHLQRRQASYRCARPLPAKAGTITKFCLQIRIYGNLLGFFTCRKAGTWDRFFYFPSEGRHTEDFPDTRKIPRTRVPVASMLTTRPPKPS